MNTTFWSLKVSGGGPGVQSRIARCSFQGTVITEDAWTSYGSVMLTKGAWVKVFRTRGRSVTALGNFLISQTHPESLLSFVVSSSPCCLSCLPMHLSVGLAGLWKGREEENPLQACAGGTCRLHLWVR